MVIGSAGACMGANTNFDQVIIYKPIKRGDRTNNKYQSFKI